MTGIFTLRIPDTPPSLNPWMHWHWAKKRKEKERWVTMITLSLCKGNRCPQDCAHVSVVTRITFARHARRDPLNFAATLYKFLDDALVMAGIIPDDTAEFISHSEPALRHRSAAEPDLWVGTEVWLIWRK